LTFRNIRYGQIETCIQGGEIKVIQVKIERSNVCFNLLKIRLEAINSGVGEVVNITLDFRLEGLEGLADVEIPIDCKLSCSCALDVACCAYNLYTGRQTLVSLNLTMRIKNQL
jgi:hypothetical protein